MASNDHRAEEALLDAHDRLELENPSFVDDKHPGWAPYGQYHRDDFALPGSNRWWDALPDPPKVSPERVTEVLPGILYQSGRIDHMKDILAQEAGIDTVIDLSRGQAHEPHGYPHDPSYLYMHWPIRDNDNAQNPEKKEGAHLPPVPTLWQVAIFIDGLLEAGHVALVHCQGGRNRSSLVLAATLMLREYSAEAAVARIEAMRPGSFSNPVFRRWVLEEARYSMEYQG